MNGTLAERLREQLDAPELRIQFEVDGVAEEIHIEAPAGQTLADLLVARLIEQAISGNVEAIAYLWDRIEGKSSQRLEIISGRDALADPMGVDGDAVRLLS